MEYFFSIPHAHDRFVNIEVAVPNPNGNQLLTLKLPSWRPGRYELGNFAKNIKGFAAWSMDGSPAGFRKTARDTWEVEAAGNPVMLTYRYYCAQLDAGACWLDHDQLYINPVHCCMFEPSLMGLPCTVHLDVPKSWKTACGMTQINAQTLKAADFHELVDSPFVSSATIQHKDYELDGIKFHIWMQGDCRPDWDKIISDFKDFTKVQLKTMGEFPAREYHFIVQLTPHAFYHGVEHLTSTVLALGPGYKLMQPGLYKEFMGVASHELFHCWNVKSIRPAEMLPYDYTKENYAVTGYVYEGITTYYGDLFLGRSGFFNLQQLLDELSVRLQKHLDNPGRNNYSVAESSFDTWLDGYVPGVPGRKVSIYDEGSLLALIMDFMIRSTSGNERSLDDVMRFLYFEFAQKGRGYTEHDYQVVCETIAGREFSEFFSNYVVKPSTLENLLAEVLSLAGLELDITTTPVLQESMYGIRTESRNGSTFVLAVYPGSPAHAAGILKDDELLAINGIRIENNISDLCGYLGSDETEWLISSSRKIRKAEMRSGAKKFYQKYKIVVSEKITAGQLKFRESWIGRGNDK